ncbi:MAG: RNA polymerase sigma factor [Sandaracinaceae bacterium]|nr:RNA polymerase sigma factor [Sandaracinaceae bacterium]
MQSYANPIYGYLVRSGIRPADRDDLFQQVFEKVHRASLRGLPDGPVRPWLFTIAANTVRDAFRRAKVRSIVELDDTAGHAEPSDDVRPDQAAEHEEELSFLDQEIAKLPLDQREALLLCAVEGLPLADAAVALDVPLNTLKTRVRRARGALAVAAQRRRAMQEREGA